MCWDIYNIELISFQIQQTLLHSVAKQRSYNQFNKVQILSLVTWMLFFGYQILNFTDTYPLSVCITPGSIYLIIVCVPYSEMGNIFTAYIELYRVFARFASLSSRKPFKFNWRPNALRCSIKCIHHLYSWYAPFPGPLVFNRKDQTIR